MKLSDVKNLTASERFVYWIIERESIRLSKEMDDPQPWTDDEILSKYRFCNVRRMDDRVSLWLMKHWYTPYRGHPHMLYAVALARFINLPSSLEKVTYLVFDYKTWRKTAIRDRLREIKDKGDKVFNAAYVVRGNDGDDKISSVVDYFVTPLVMDPPKIDTTSMRNTWGAIEERFGFGSFMAGQVTADLRHAMDGTWNDRMTWAPPGPGSMRGMSRLLGKPLETVYSSEVFNRNLQVLLKKVINHIPLDITIRLEAHDWQNCLCEYDKYERTLWGDGKPKQLYRMYNPHSMKYRD